jgi:hypothetical protein
MAKTKLQAVIKRGECDAANGEFQIPEEFQTIKDLWAKKDPECFRLMQKHIVALFISENLVETPDWLDGEKADELEASALEITGLVFNDSDLPVVSAVAVFDLPTSRAVSATELEQWEDEAGESLDNAISFEWRLKAKYEDEFPSHTLSAYDELRVAIID